MADSGKLFAQALVIAICAFLSALIEKKFGIQWYIANLCAVISTVLLIFCLEKSNYFRGIGVFRKFLFGKLWRFEGYWISKFENTDRPFSISKIYYSHNQPVWRHRGFALSPSLSRVLNWKSSSIYYNRSNYRWLFEGNWSALSDSGTAFQHISVIQADNSNRNLI